MTERERLIEMIEEHSCLNGDCEDMDCGKCTRFPLIKESAKKIADYLLTNGVIVPPCKVGDKLYYLCGSKVFNLTVEKIVIKEEGMFLVDKAFNDWYSIEELGKSLYLSEEEAEQALRKEDKGK